MSSYGYFNDEAREYVVTNPRTPVKWVNYVGTLDFGGLVDHTGGSVLCAGDPALNRILKYIPQLPSSDLKGAGLYIRLHTDEGYKVFSPFYTPTMDDYELFECHVGLGYQRIVSVFYGIRTEATIFIPPNAPVEVRDIKVTNESNDAVTLDIIPIVEYTHFEAFKQFNNADWVPQTMITDADLEADGKVVLKQYAFMKKESRMNFFTSNAPVDSFQSDRKIFLGDNEYGTWKNPLELQNPRLGNNEARRGDNIGALLHACGTLVPGASKTITTLLGQGQPDEIAGMIAKYREPGVVENGLQELKAFWNDYLGQYHCETPDPAFNTMVNVHNPRQCYMTLNWSRYLSLYQLGLGARGIGFRDSSQDVMGALASAPEKCKSMLQNLLSVQNPNGSAMHQFFPLTMEANEGDAREEGDKLTYGDDHLWVIQAVCAYVKETGDYAFLEEEITFYDKELPLAEREKAPVLEHLLRGLAYTKANTGQHGIPLLGFADWNDTVNLPGKAESLFNANLYGRGILELIELAEYQGNEVLIAELRDDHVAMKAVVNEHAWDGEWYTRYFMENGEPIGSHKNDKGQIYTNGQSWPVISGFAEGERAQQALDSVHDKLNTEFGIKLSTPGYDCYDEEIGGVTSYPPGAKENGGIFLHSNPWVMIAETMMGNGDRAYQYYNQISPASKNDDMDRYECEPYCYAQNILGDEHPQFGLGRNSWLSGTASWTYQAATQYIMGVRPGHGGLVVDPCVPKAWKEFSITRKFRGATYKIKVQNPDGVSKGIASIVVNGQSVSGQVLPLVDVGVEADVLVVMGETSCSDVAELKSEVVATVD